MMAISKKFLIRSCYILIDIFFAAVSIYMVCKLRQDTLPFDVTFHNIFVEGVDQYRYVFLFWTLVTILLNNAYGLYFTKRELFETAEIVEVIKSVITATLMTIVAIYLIRIEYFPRSIIVIGPILMSLFFSFWRVLKRIFVEYLVSQGYNNFNALIVGAGKVGSSLADEISKKSQLGIHVIGFLDDNFEQSLLKKGPKVLGKVTDFPRIARREFINKIFITSHYESPHFIKLLEQAKDLGVAIRVVPHGFELMTGELQNYTIGFIPILEYSRVRYHRRQVGKRFFDFIASLLLTSIIMPLFVLIAILIKLDSPGPIFYFSKRYGNRGRVFHMIKFRSMVDDADKAIDQYLAQNEVDGPIFKIKKDPRITKIGKVLRKYSLDELPQLFNVIKGEMSLVGPRPLPINQVQKEDLKQLQRLEVRPGITGLWQIKGRSDLSFSRLVKWDVWYINNWSLLLDLKILFQTIPVVIKGKGAY